MIRANRRTRADRDVAPAARGRNLGDNLGTIGVELLELAEELRGRARSYLAEEAERLYGIAHDGDWYHVGTPDGIDQADAEILENEGARVRLLF